LAVTRCEGSYPPFATTPMQCAQFDLHDIEASTARCRMQLTRVQALIACVICAFSAVKYGWEMPAPLVPAVKLNGIPRFLVSQASRRPHYGSKKAVQRPGQQGRGGATRSLKYDPTFISRPGIIYVGRATEIVMVSHSHALLLRHIRNHGVIPTHASTSDG